MKILLASLIVFISSCSHHHKNKDHHHHDKKDLCSKCEEHNHKNDMYKKNCAHSVLEGSTHVPGKEEYKLKHGGRTYYFSSKEKMDSFEANLEENVKKANERWENGW